MKREAYVNDALVKSIKISDHIKNLEEAFNALQCHQMKLNLTKYIFGITFKILFFGFLITNQGIEANFEKNKGDSQHKISLH